MRVVVVGNVFAHMDSMFVMSVVLIVWYRVLQTQVDSSEGCLLPVVEGHPVAVVDFVAKTRSGCVIAMYRTAQWNFTQSEDIPLRSSPLLIRVYIFVAMLTGSVASFARLRQCQSDEEAFRFAVSASDLRVASV